MHVAQFNSQPIAKKILRTHTAVMFIALLGPTIFGLIQNRWFMGRYSIQMGLNKKIRNQFPSSDFSIGIYSTFEDIGYLLEDRDYVICFGAAHIILSALYCGLRLSCCDQIRFKNLYKIAEYLFIASAGIQQVDSYTVQPDVPAIMLSVFEDSSFMLFRLSATFHLMVAITLLCGLVMEYMDCGRGHGKTEMIEQNYLRVNDNRDSLGSAHNDEQQEEELAFQGFDS